jgi:hypoxanthine phosphoribosyltransferase
MGCQLKDNQKIVLTAEQIRKKVKELGLQISQDFSGHSLTVVGVLKGSFVFMADLIREIKVPTHCDFLRISSYDTEGKSSAIRLEFDLTQPIENEDVLLVEGILDTGKTLRYLLSHLSTKNPKSLNVCCLLDKGLDPEMSGQVRYVGFKVPKTYLVGYGLDLAGNYRELPHIASIDLPS